jgi:hypothetical protein
MNQRCIENQTSPDLEQGAVVEDGTFFRNLKKKHVIKRYTHDSDDDPRLGFKFAKKLWNDAMGQGALSVNLVVCMHSAQCSIALQPTREHYYHVATLDLRALNSVLEAYKQNGESPSPLVARYSPIKETHNRCHFEILPKDGTTLKWMELMVCLDIPSPSPPLPSPGSEEEKKAIAAYEQFQSYCKIIRWVRGKDGSLG